MSAELKLLFLEDNPDDAVLIERLLRKAGLQFNAVVASNEQEFLTALKQNGYHAVLADNALPQYSSMEALELIRATNPHVAFVLVTGTVSEEFAVRIIQQGADDYILKTNLTRLPAALTNAIEKKRSQREKEMERDLSDSIINSLPGVFYLCNILGQFIRWNHNLESVSGYTAEEVIRMKPVDFFEPELKQAVMTWIQTVFSKGHAETEAIVLTRKGKKIPYLFTGTTILYAGQTCLMGIGVDISSSKESERELKQLNQQLRNLSDHLHKIREEEQSRIAREIHDELGQQITGLKMEVNQAMKDIDAQVQPEKIQARLSEMKTLLDETVKSIRKIASELRPSILDDLGLMPALDWQSKEFERRFSIPVEFLSNADTGLTDANTNIAIFRMYQESLTNIARHAAATKVVCQFLVLPGELVLRITDDGKGFDMQEAMKKKSLGLLGMKERAYMIGATVQIHSEPGKGTTIVIKVPVSS
jgi:two-component system sensor histidine kinase UhpB